MAQIVAEKRVLQIAGYHDFKTSAQALACVLRSVSTKRDCIIIHSFLILYPQRMKNSKITKLLPATLLGALAIASSVQGATYSLSNGPGDGSVSVGVDGYGSFGLAVGGNSTDALYDPVGAGGPTATTFESGVAIRFGSAGTRSFMTSGDIFGTGSLANPTVTGTTTSGSSTFALGGLSFVLTQTLTPIFTGITQTGSLLTQSYAITNTSAGSLDFELVRYLDGDLRFDGGLVDGGGRLFAGSTEILFETDSATGAATPTTFVGITAEGGSHTAASGRYEIDSYAGLGGRIVTGTALDGIITGDGGDADQFIDAGGGYDVTLALNNAYSLPAGASTTYVTNTVFGAGEPERVTPQTPVPEGGHTLALMGIGLASVEWLRRRMKKS